MTSLPFLLAFPQHDKKKNLINIHFYKGKKTGDSGKIMKLSKVFVLFVYIFLNAIFKIIYTPPKHLLQQSDPITDH